jgi:hypothetical protein
VRARFVIVVVPVMGCGLISGLDTLNVADATTDAGSSEAAEDASEAEASNDASPLGCTVPADCIDGGVLDAAYPPSSGEVCCGTIETTGVTGHCALVSFTTHCAAPLACASSFPTTACTSDTVRLCQHASECVEQDLGDCCQFKQEAGVVQFCTNLIVAMVGNATCLSADE